MLKIECEACSGFLYVALASLAGLVYGLSYHLSGRLRVLVAVHTALNMAHLTAGNTLPLSNRDHSLAGNYVNHRECHIEPDWLLIYRVNQEKKRIELVRTGSHSELFR